MSGFSVHPATRLIVWLLLLVGIQYLSGWSLALAFLLLPLFGTRALWRGVHLARRARWLLVSLFAVFSWGVAGEPAWPGFASPTLEGLQEATIHLGRLILVMMSVGIFLEKMPLPDLLAATHILLKPFGSLGLDPDRGVVRLMLVLHYVEALPRPRDWRTLLDVPEAIVHESVEVDRHPLFWIDYSLIAVIAIAMVSLCLFQGQQ